MIASLYFFFIRILSTRRIKWAPNLLVIPLKSWYGPSYPSINPGISFSAPSRFLIHVHSMTSIASDRTKGLFSSGFCSSHIPFSRRKLHFGIFSSGLSPGQESFTASLNVEGLSSMKLSAHFPFARIFCAVFDEFRQLRSMA